MSTCSEEFFVGSFDDLGNWTENLKGDGVTTGDDETATIPINGPEGDLYLSQGHHSENLRFEATPEPEKIRKWREEQKIMLEEKDNQEEKDKEELKQKAEKELEEWYKQYNETMAKRRAENRKNEKMFNEKSTEENSVGNWQRIAKLCDLDGKNVRPGKDVTRMRSVLIKLKQTSTINEEEKGENFDVGSSCDL